MEDELYDKMKKVVAVLFIWFILFVIMVTAFGWGIALSVYFIMFAIDRLFKD